MVFEIKSSQTIKQSFFKGMNYFSELSNSLPKHNYLIYGGNEIQKRTEATVLSWENLDLIDK